MSQIKHCIICGKDISDRQSHAVMCASKKCQNTRKRRMVREARQATIIKCHVCGKAFRARSINGAYCGPDCAVIGKRAQEKVHRQPKPTVFDGIRPDDWTQEKYEAQEEILKAPNGRTCQWDGCDEPLIGNDRFHCVVHQNRCTIIEASVLHDGGGDTGKRSWVNAM